MFWDDDTLAINKRSKKKQKAKPRALETLNAPVYVEIPYVEFNDMELYMARGATFVFDVETYRNYFLIAFKCLETNKVVICEDTPEETFNRSKLNFVLYNFRLVSFNGRKYDIPMVTLALYGADASTLKEASDLLVDNEMPFSYKDFQKKYGFKHIQTNHIDLFDVAPLKASLKLYAGRLHCKRMQDLPYNPDKNLTPVEARRVRFYCVNDLDNTGLMWFDLLPQIKLRETLSEEYQIDLRSRSDAQIAEHVISKECEKINGYWAKRPVIEPGTVYKYEVPDFVFFQTPELQTILENLRNAEFIISDKGRPKCDYLHGLKIKIGNSLYRMGVGGLHSSESATTHRADENTMLIDRDVASFYPRIILNLGLFPKHLGKAFLQVYESLVQRRLDAKGLSKVSDLTISEINQVIADSIKITINGSFGKLGSKYSALYSPDLLIQVTLTGQLALLMLIEGLELVGIPIVSANTDGIVIKCPNDRYADLNNMIKLWENHTHFETEETQYKALYSRDVNNYVAVKKFFDKKTKQWINEFPEVKDNGKPYKLSDKFKGKGVFSEATIWKNPANGICIDALSAFLVEGIDIAHTVEACTDIKKFVTVRTVKGGAYQGDDFIGKAVRWYYARNWDKTMNYMLSGNLVPKSEGAKPCMTLPDEFPKDVDIDWYVNEANDFLRDVGYYGTSVPREIEEIELFDSGSLQKVSDIERAQFNIFMKRITDLEDTPFAVNGEKDASQLIYDDDISF